MTTKPTRAQLENLAVIFDIKGYQNMTNSQLAQAIVEAADLSEQAIEENDGLTIKERQMY